MASAHVTISVLDLEPVQHLMFAANDLLCAAKELDDPALAYAVVQFEEALENIRPSDEGA